MNFPSSPTRLFLLTNLASPHSIKWIRGLSARGYEVTVFSLSPYDPENYAGLPGFMGYSLGLSDDFVKTASGRWGKLRYLGALGRIRALVREHQPHILHAHRASSYGLLGVLTGFRPLVVSVWGDDVYVFPERGKLFARVLRFVLSRADRVLSTSKVMAARTARFTDKPISVTPFGIDMEKFSPVPAAGNRGKIVIGTIKTLEDKYGIDVLLRAFAGVVAAVPELPLELLIVGTGSRRAALEELTETLALTEQVTFTGRIPFDEVPAYHNRIDIFAALSVIDAESFGVSIVEASACGRPVVVSDAGGPAEVVDDGKTGFVVPMRDVSAATEALLRLVRNPQLRTTMGEAGRAHVRSLYDWEDNLTTMTEIYRDILDKGGAAGAKEGDRSTV